MDPSPYCTLIEVLVIVISALICCIITAAVKALDSVNRNEIKEMAEDGDGKAKKLTLIFKKMSNFMMAATIVKVLLAIVSITLIFKEILQAASAEDNMVRFPLFLCVGAFLVTMLILVFVEIIPRQFALKNPEKAALKLAGFAHFISVICRPFVKLDRGISHVFLKILGKGGYTEEDEFSEEEVMSMLEVGQETGVLKEEGKKMIDKVFAFDDKLAYEIMTPRTDVFVLDIDDQTEEELEELMTLKYSRIPVYEDDSDNIIGIINIKDFFLKAREFGFENVDFRSILRKPFFVPDTKNIDSLFVELQKTKQHIAILIDEYGGFSGIVTMEDIIEEVMGEIDDEYDEVEQDIKQINYHTYIIDGNVDLDDLNEEIGTDLESDNSETLGGLLIDTLGEIPEDGSTREIQIRNYHFTIESVKDRRVEQVRLVIEDEEEEKEEKVQ